VIPTVAGAARGPPEETWVEGKEEKKEK